MPMTLEQNGEHIRLEVYANGGARSTVAAFQLQPDRPPLALGTDCINLNRATERAKWAASFPPSMQEEALQLAMALGIEIERERQRLHQAQANSATGDTTFPAIEPWPAPVDGATLLDELSALIRCYIVLPEHGVTTLALWIMHTYAAAVAEYSPYIHLRSPVRGCGKSTVQQLLEQTAYRACRSDGITAAALYRRIDRLSPTMLLDELDTRLKGDSGELLRGVLNSGFQKGGRITICVGDDHEERDFNTFCPKCLAGIGRLWDTVASRSIAIRMEKASRAELKRLTKLRGDRIKGICEPVRRRLRRWADDTLPLLSDADPDVPEEMEARQADVWRPLLAIADVAGGAWPARARAAASALSCGAMEEGDHALMLLEDVRALYDSEAVIDGDKLTSSRIVLELAKREDRPWPEYRHDKPITTTQLAKLLGRFDIKSKNIRLPAGDVVKGYRYADCQAAFDRYLQIPATCAATSATASYAPTIVADVAAQKHGIGEEEQRELEIERAGMQADA